MIGSNFPKEEGRRNAKVEKLLVGSLDRWHICLVRHFPLLTRARFLGSGYLPAILNKKNLQYGSSPLAILKGRGGSWGRGCKGRTGENFWNEVVAVRTEHREIRTKTTEGQYSSVRLEQAGLVNSLLYGTRLIRYFSFKTHFRSVADSKDFRRVMPQATQREQVTMTLKTIYWTSKLLTSVIYGFHFWFASQSGGLTFTIQFFQLDWSRRVLSLPKEHLIWIRFRQLAEWLLIVLCTSA